MRNGLVTGGQMRNRLATSDAEGVRTPRLELASETQRSNAGGGAIARPHAVVACGRRKNYCSQGSGEGGGAIVAGSQCSSALPSTKRQVSNQVVV